MNHRENCPLRHTNGNCLVIGGFCTAIKSEICNGLQQAYEHGRLDAIKQKHPECVLAEREKIDKENVIKGLQEISDEAYSRWVHCQSTRDKLIINVEKYVDKAIALLQKGNNR